MNPTGQRFLLYSHDGQGLGHARRHLAIARALVGLDPGASVLLATGVEELPGPGLPPNVEVLKLPSLRKVANGRYVSRRLPLSVRATRQLRSSLLLTAVKSFRPAVVLADKHPFGASGEFRSALAAARRQGARSALGLRDILDDAETVRREWRPHGLPGAIGGHYDEVLIYGERRVFDAVTEYGFPGDLAGRSHFCGYVVNAPPGWSRRRSERPVVVATAGAGEDGWLILETFLRAAVDAPWRAVAVIGPHAPHEQAARLMELARAAGAECHGYVPQLEARLAGADAVVCMGGYNTLGEVVASGVPTVCVPRTAPRREQWIRARCFAGLGLLRMIAPEALTPEVLRAELACALAARSGRRVAGGLNFAGAETAAARLLALAAAAVSGVRDSAKVPAVAAEVERPGEGRGGDEPSAGDVATETVEGGTAHPLAEGVEAAGHGAWGGGTIS